LPDSPVKNRHVFIIRGYEPIDSDAIFKQTARELTRFDDTWNVKTDIGIASSDHDDHVAVANLTSTGEGWKVNTNYSVLAWDDLVLKDFARPLPVRLWHYLVTYFDYVLSGTAFSFFRTSWRFALYFLYPAVMLMVFTLLSLVVAWGLLLFDFPGSPFAAIALAVGVYFGLLQWLGKRWHVLHLMDLWSFSREYLRNQRPDADARFEGFARAVVKSVQAGEADEILLIGHSTGGAIILDIAAMALAIDPQLASRKSKVTLLTIGSTALKIGLHPAAKKFRGKVQTLVDCKSLSWIEYQSHTDIINFDKTDPVQEMKLSSDRGGEFPVVQRVRIRDMLQKKTYDRIKRIFFRVHYQFILGNTKPYFYDFFMFCCGPIYLVRRAKQRIAGAVLPDKEE
jgi:hypothetical protein